MPIYFQTDKDVGFQQALAFVVVNDIGDRRQGHSSVPSSFQATPLGFCALLQENRFTGLIIFLFFLGGGEDTTPAIV